MVISILQVSCSGMGSVSGNIITTATNVTTVLPGNSYNLSHNDDPTDKVDGHEKLTGKDASWILTTAVIIFTMQTGQ